MHLVRLCRLYDAKSRYNFGTGTAAVMAQFSGLGIDLTKGVQANYNLNVDLKFPQSLGFGASYAALSNFKVACDVEWINWANALII